MFELVRVSEKCLYVSCPSKIGIVELGEGNVCLIDAGSDKDAGKKVLKHIRENGWNLVAIYVTHSHADHIGGCAYLQSQTGCKIYAKGIEADFVNHPILEPSLVWSACPPSALKHKFLLAQESKCEALCADVLPSCMEIIDLGGHSPEMVGFKVDDGAVFVGDAFSSEATLEKYRVGYIYDIDTYIKSLLSLKEVKGKIFVPSHANVSEDISGIIDYNLENTEKISQKILEICTQGATHEQILKKIFDFYTLALTYEQFGLVGSTIRAYITYLLENGKIEGCFDGNELKYFTKTN